MKQGERDDLQAQQTHAVRSIAGTLRRAELERKHAERDRAHGAAFPPLRRLFGGERGAVALLRSIPGFAELWRREVPERAVRDTVDREGRTWRLVTCPCGEHPALVAGAIADCSCGRWFFSTGRTIRVKRFEEAAA